MAEAEKEERKVFVPKSAAELQKIRLNKLMSKPEKPVVIPDRPEEKLPRVFNPPEFVRNIWGSSAGAGSGDFHVYRGVRRREYARQKFLDQQHAKNDLDAAYKEKVEINKKAAEERTAKKRAKRQKKKMRQKMKKFKMNQNKSEAAKRKDTDSSEDEESDQDQNENEKTQENNAAAIANNGQSEANLSDDSREQSSTSNQNNVEDNSDDSDSEDSESQREKERRAILASQPEDVEDNSCSDEETES